MTPPGQFFDLWQAEGYAGLIVAMIHRMELPRSKTVRSIHPKDQRNWSLLWVRHDELLAEATRRLRHDYHD